MYALSKSFPPDQPLLASVCRAALLVLLSVTLLLCCNTWGQVNPGYPSWSAYDGHEIDTVNLQNLNVVLNIPVWSKAGAFPLDVQLKGNHYFLNQGGEWFLLGGTIAYGNNILGNTNTWASYTTTSPGTCVGGGSTTLYRYWYVMTGDGAHHWLPPTDYTDSAGCLSPSFTDAVIDGTGYTLTATGSSASYVYTRSGMQITIGVNDVGQLKDPNGNRINFSGIGNYTYTDTLGVKALSQNGGTTGATLTWNDISGHPQSVTPTYSSDSFYFTDFACPGIIDANGSVPWTKLTNLAFPDGTNIGISYEQTPNNPNEVTGRLRQLTLREGGTITYAYSGANNGMNCTYGVVPTLKRTTSDGTTQYVWTTQNNGSGNWGNTTTVTDQGGNTTVYSFTGLTSTGNAALPVVQALTQVQHKQGASTLLTTDVYCYNGLSGQPGDCPTAVVSLPITEVDVYHTISGMSTSSRTQTMYDKYGNITYSAQYDFGSSSPTLATSITYGTCTANCTASTPTISAIGSNINDRRARVVTTGNRLTVAETRYTYDGHGNLLTTYVWNGATWLSNSTPNVYNGNGTPATSYDLANNPTAYGYSSSDYASCPTGGCATYPFPTSISKDGIETFSTWNAAGSVKLTDIDANSQTTTYGYTACTGGAADPFWRLMSVTDPLGNEVCEAYPSGSSPTTYNSTLVSSGETTIQNVTTTGDGYRRKIDAQNQFSTSSFDTVTTTYGWSTNYKEMATSQPCSTTALGDTCSTVHTFLYDPLGRLYQESTASNETITHTFTQNDDLRVLTPAPSGENTKQVQKQYDGLGRLTSSCRISSTASGNVSCGQNTNTSAKGILTTTAYTYSTGSSTVARTRGVQSRSVTKDAIGRVIQIVVPEAGTLQGSTWVAGAWNYIYDTNSSCPSGYRGVTGLLASVSDPNGNLICFSYDGANRKTGVNASGTTCRHFYYDNSKGYNNRIPSGVTPANSMGRMVEAATDACSSGTLITDEWFSYDVDGRMTDMWELTPHSGGYYHTTVVYFANGAVSSLSGIPGYAPYTYTIDAEGRPYSVIHSGSSIVNSVAYNAASKPTTITYFNGDTDTYVYDPDTGRVTSYTFNVASTSDSGTLTWNLNGTLQQLVIVDDVQLATDSQTCTFSYDDLARLITDNCGSQWSQTFSYNDAYDNVSKSGSSNWIPGYNASNNHYSSIGATYDNDGDLSYDSFNTYTWDAHGKMASVQTGKSPANCGSSGTCVTYDAMGRAVEMNVAGVFSEVLYSPIGETAIMSGPSTVTVSYIPMPGGGYMWANTAGGANQVLEHRDWLGSVRLEINPGNGVDTTRSVHAYAPFGETYDVYTNCCGTVNFTGDKQDLFAGLYDTPNRELNQTAGRWLSPDPARARWNQYAYATNPNSQLDPSGLDSCGGDNSQDGDPGDGGNGGNGGGGNCGDGGVAGPSSGNSGGSPGGDPGGGDSGTPPIDPFNLPPGSFGPPDFLDPQGPTYPSMLTGLDGEPAGITVVGLMFQYNGPNCCDSSGNLLFPNQPPDANIVANAFDLQVVNGSGDALAGNFLVTENVNTITFSGSELVSNISAFATFTWITGASGNFVDNIGFFSPSDPSFMHNLQGFSINGLPSNTLNQFGVYAGGSLVSGYIGTP